MPVSLGANADTNTRLESIRMNKTYPSLLMILRKQSNMPL